LVPVGELPRILGHEFSGEVAGIGPGVSGYEEGDRVVADINIGCGRCVYCHRGQHLRCDGLRQIGVHVDGAFAEFVRVPVQALRRIPAAMSFEAAALTEPLACALHGEEQVGLQPGEVVVVLGCGPMGLLHCMLSRLRGAACVISCEPNEFRRDFSLRVGADCAVGAGADVIRDAVLDRTDGQGADVVIEAVGSAPTYRTAIALARPGGRVLFFGAAAPNDEIPLHPFDVYRRELTMVGSYAGSYGSWDQAIALLSAGRIPATDLVTSVRPLEELEASIEAIATRPDAMKIQIAVA
jgi:threonine dehydrogenase-like Zn-dependent dehydrogenase